MGYSGPWSHKELDVNKRLKKKKQTSNTMIYKHLSILSCMLLGKRFVGPILDNICRL